MKMALTSNIQKLWATKQLIRKYSSDVAKLTNVVINEKTGVSTLTMQRPPVNSLNLELLSELSNSLSELEKNKCRGLILTSASKSVFSAGLDITEMYKPDPERFKNFWTTLQDVWIKLYGSSFPTVAAINGHSPAGGCLLAMCCEYRVMLNNCVIGLNETQLGIVAPKWFISTMKHTIGSRQTELALTQGRLFKTEEALKIGLIDEAAASKEEIEQKAEAFLNSFAKIPPLARSLTKKFVRGKDIEEMSKNRQEDLKMVTELMVQDKVQNGLGMYLESLKKKANK